MSTGSDIGSISKNLENPLAIAGDLLYLACYIIGCFFVINALTQYRMHRKNPKQVALTTPIFLLILGIGCLAFPSINQLSSSAPKLNSALLIEKQPPLQPGGTPVHWSLQPQTPPPAPPTSRLPA